MKKEIPRVKPREPPAMREVLLHSPAVLEEWLDLTWECTYLFLSPKWMARK